MKPPLLVVRLSALGDVIHTLPAVASLREHFDITWAIEPAYAPLVEKVLNVRTLQLPMKRWKRKPQEIPAVLRRVSRTEPRFAASVDFQGLLKSALIPFLLRVKERYGFDRNASREAAASRLTRHRIGVNRSRHVVEWNTQLASGVAGMPITPASLDFSTFLEPIDCAGEIVLLPGAGKANKQWPVERFAALATHFGSRAITAWGPGEEELADAVGGRKAPATSLPQLAYLLSRARLVIGGDTGPLHLAAALGTAVVGLYGPTSEKRNGPYTQIDFCVSTFSATRRMEDVSFERVLELSERRLDLLK